MDITELTVHELIKKIKNKELTVTEINQAYIDRINLREKDIQAFITVLDKEALERSKNISNNLSELAGIPIGIKDNICTKNIKTTCASKMLENFVSPYDATVVERLENKGLINIGKLNMDEFAMGGSTEYSAFKVTKNTRNIEAVQGGS